MTSSSLKIPTLQIQMIQSTSPQYSSSESYQSVNPKSMTPTKYLKKSFHIQGSLFFKRRHVSIIAFLEMLTKECLLPSINLSFSPEDLDWKMHHIRGVLRKITSAMTKNPRLADSFSPLAVSRTNTLPSTIPTISMPSLRFLRTFPDSSVGVYSSTSFFVTNSWVEGHYTGLGDVCVFRRDPMRDLGFICLENIYGSAPIRYEFPPSTLLFDDSQIDGSVFKISLPQNDHDHLSYSSDLLGKQSLPLDRWDIPVPIGGMTHVQFYRDTRLLCPGQFCQNHAAYLLREGPGFAAKHGLAPHQIAICSSSYYSFV